jgi:methionyl-tRNA formyltransferase
LEARLAPLGARLALKTIDEIAAGTAHGVKQDKSQVTKAPKLKKEDGLIDWSRSAEQVCNQIRAMQPWPTAYTYYHRQGKPPLRVIITKAVDPEFPDSTWRPLPGHLRVSTGPYLLAWAAKDPVMIEELQPAGKKRMSAAEFLRGHPIKEGDHFGPENE